MDRGLWEGSLHDLDARMRRTIFLSFAECLAHIQLLGRYLSYMAVDLFP